MMVMKTWLFFTQVLLNGCCIRVPGKNGNKQGDSRSRSILKNKESRGTDSELLLQETTSLGANVSITDAILN